MKLLSHIPSWIRNKFLLTGVAFLVWITFFDSKDIFSQYERRHELKELRESKAYFEGEIAKEKKALKELKDDPAAIEKFAREKYLMKRDNEDLYLIQKPGKE